MPCLSPSSSEIREMESERNEREIGLRGPEERVATHVACEALGLLEDQYSLTLLSEPAKRWWARHKQQDEARKRARELDREREDARRSAIRKLSPEERRALGILL